MSNNNNNLVNNELSFILDTMDDKKTDKKAKTFVTNIWGRIKNKKETELTAGSVVIGKYWVCAQTVYFGIRPEKAACYNTIADAQKAFVQLYNLHVEGDFVIAKDINTGKFFIKAQ